MLPLIGPMRRRRMLMLAVAVVLIFMYLRSPLPEPEALAPAVDDAALDTQTPTPAPPNEESAPISTQEHPSNEMDTSTAPAANDNNNNDDDDDRAPAQQPETSETTSTPGQTAPPEDPEEEEDEPPKFEAAELPPDTKFVVVGGRKYIDPGSRPMVAMEYGTTARPPVRGLTKVLEELPVELLIDDANNGEGEVSSAAHPADADGPLRRRRFVFIGDVHGQRESLDALLDKISFQTGRDHLVLVGDLVNKGPDSPGVVQRAMELGASAVRGNHEDRVLAAYDAMHAGNNAYAGKPWQAVGSAADGGGGSVKRRMTPGENVAAAEGNSLDVDPLEQNPFPRGDMPERKTAASLSPEQAAWLADLPVILHIGKIAPAPSAGVSPQVQEANAAQSPFNDVVVAHAGLVPDVPLERQDPYAVMVMRSLVHPADEVRQERARLVAELRIRAESRGRIRPNQYVNVPQQLVDAEFHRMQTAVYGADPHHPRRPSPPGSPKTKKKSTAGGGNPSPADLVVLPIEGHFREGADRVHWAAAWNQAQHEKPSPANRTTVIYGHDAITGLLVPEAVPGRFMSLLGAGGTGVKSGSVVSAADTGYTFGLDSGAVYGGKLTALVVEADRSGRVKYSLEQVPCPAYAKKRAD